MSEAPDWLAWVWPVCVVAVGLLCLVLGVWRRVKRDMEWQRKLSTRLQKAANDE
jgi:cytochrome c-type biogenesis protein CcmH/NrfF